MLFSCYSCACLCYGNYEQNTCVWYCVMWAVYKSKERILDAEILQNGGVNPRWSRISNVWMVCQTIHRESSFHKFRVKFTESGKKLWHKNSSILRYDVIMGKTTANSPEFYVHSELNKSLIAHNSTDCYKNFNYFSLSQSPTNTRFWWNMWPNW